MLRNRIDRFFNMNVFRRTQKPYAARTNKNRRNGFDVLVFAIVALCVPIEIYRYLPVRSTDDVRQPHCSEYDAMRCTNGGSVQITETGRLACTNADPYSVVDAVSWLTRVFDNVDVNLRTGRPGTWWSFLPFTSDLQLKTVYQFHQNNVKMLEMFTNVHNNHYEIGSEKNMARILLPTRPLECSGSYKYLPQLAVLNNKIVLRKPGQFKPDPKRRNILSDTFYQYFILQFFDADFNLTVSASQLYGANEVTQRELRSFSNGKLKTERLNNEHYPPSLSFTKRIKTIFFPTNSALKSTWFDGIVDSAPKWTLGHPLLSVNPLLFVMSTLWIREHNRVCDVLRRQWPAWTDDQLFDTARRIIIGEMMEIMMNEVINVRADRSLSLRHKPEIFHGRLANINGNSATPLELLLTAMWPSSLPDDFNGTSMHSVFFGNNRQVIADGMSNTVRFMVNREIGIMAHGNYGNATEPMTSLLMRLSRENALQSFNNYRRKLGLYPYMSFYDLTENWETVETLKSLYENVEDVELLTGMLTEKRKQGILPTVTVMQNSLIVNSILTNHLASRDSWKPVTFGGNVGFNIVRSATVESFVCNNLVNNCDGLTVKLHAN